MFGGGHSAIAVGTEPYFVATHMCIQLRFSSSGFVGNLKPLLYKSALAPPYTGWGLAKKGT